MSNTEELVDKLMESIQNDPEWEIKCAGEDSPIQISPEYTLSNTKKDISITIKKNPFDSYLFELRFKGMRILSGEPVGVIFNAVNSKHQKTKKEKEDKKLQSTQEDLLKRLSGDE